MSSTEELSSPANDLDSKDFNKVHNALKKIYFSKENLEKTAYKQWEREGRPDGDKIVKGMSNKDRHWLMAKIRSELLLDIDAETIWLYNNRH